MIYSLAAFFADYFKIEREIFVSQNWAVTEIELGKACNTLHYTLRLRLPVSGRQLSPQSNGSAGPEAQAAGQAGNEDASRHEELAEN